jgi:hypothetical protein
LKGRRNENIKRGKKNILRKGREVERGNKSEWNIFASSNLENMAPNRRFGLMGSLT